MPPKPVETDSLGGEGGGISKSIHGAVTADLTQELPASGAGPPQVY